MSEYACSGFRELIPWVATATAPPEERALVYLHTAACTGCRRDLARALALTRSVKTVMASLPERPDGLLDRVLRAIGERATGEPATRLLRKLLPWLDDAGLPVAASAPIRMALFLTRS